MRELTAFAESARAAYHASALVLHYCAALRANTLLALLRAVIAHTAQRAIRFAFSLIIPVILRADILY